MEYIFICILFTFIPVASEPDTCLFTPHSSRSCLEYWVPPGVKHGCIESTVGLEFAGLSHHLNGEALINLHHRGKNVSYLSTHYLIAYIRGANSSRAFCLTFDVYSYSLLFRTTLVVIGTDSICRCTSKSSDWKCGFIIEEDKKNKRYQDVTSQNYIT